MHHTWWWQAANANANIVSTDTIRNVFVLFIFKKTPRTSSRPNVRALDPAYGP